MNRPLKILILEDDKNECYDFIHCVEKTDDVTIVGCTANSDDALAIFKSETPDAVIVDLELHSGTGNGLQFLSSVHAYPNNNQTFFLVTTNNSSHTTHEVARKLGADFILTKYEPDYSARYVIDFLRMMNTTICNQQTEAKATHTTTSPTDSTKIYTPEKVFIYNIPETDLLSYIRNEIIDIGINPKAVGFQYLSDAVLVKLKDPNANIYNTLGPKYKRSDPSIERAMQYAINNAWRTGDPDELLRKYSARIRAERGVPTIMEFIFFYVSKAKNEFNIK